MCPLLHWRERPENHSQQLWRGHDFDDMDNLHDLREQVGRGPHTPLAIQVAVAVMTPVETSYPLTQV